MQWLSLRSMVRSSFFSFGIVRKISGDASKQLLKKEFYNDNKIVRLIFNDVKRRNALSLEMIEAIQKELTEADVSKTLRAVILAAEGPAFSSGHDLKQLRSSEGWKMHTHIFDSCTKMMSLVQNMSIPVIAEVKGMAAAAGCQLVAACDIVVAGKNSKFCTPGAKIGLFCSTPGIALVRAVPRKIALDMLLTADVIDAQEALRAGLVSRVVEDSQVKDEAIKIAQKIASFSRSVISLGKNFFYVQTELPVNDAYRMGERIMVDNLRLKDAQEGISAFIEKRSPAWTDSNIKVN